ncbi:hypothetical protein [Pseudomonas sp. Q11]|uniref:hypothetical protein n=1 Tax=Pseudomonas sp. Q11 TaxID=2968470 RepID=UPI00210B53A8|nr:hypothetical protein [Pseudomonas sp. Q11]MCQ6255339.1 hypothetical protein [Pseudomonas sp. Q11]
MDLKLSDWVTIGAAFVTAIPVIWGAFQYLLIKRAEEKDRQFKNYHGMIQNLVETATYIDRQVAAVFELRHYPAYFPATHRLLSRLKTSWSKSPNQHVGAVIEEIDKTLAYIERSGHRYLD